MNVIVQWTITATSSKTGGNHIVTDPTHSAKKEIPKGISFFVEGDLNDRMNCLPDQSGLEYGNIKII